MANPKTFTLLDQAPLHPGPLRLARGASWQSGPHLAIIESCGRLQATVTRPEFSGSRVLHTIKLVDIWSRHAFFSQNVHV